MTSRPRPLLVVTLTARTRSEAREEARGAAQAGAEVVELRLDRWDEAERSQVGEVLPLPVPAMATLRSRAEGGDGPDDPAERRRWLAAFAELPFRYLDLERARDPAPTIEAGSSARGKIVLSEHLASLPAPDDLRRRLATAPADVAFTKVVLPATLGEVLDRILPALPPPGEGRYVVHTVGGAGGLLRAWAPLLGFAAVYAAPPPRRPGDRPVEPSQLPATHLAGFLASPEGSPLFAVLGRPVAFSRSPALHHRWMRAIGRAGLYLPLEVVSEGELLDAVPRLARGGFRGVNVTHPWKVAALAAADRVTPDAAACGCANTLTFADGEVEASNTDLQALLRRFLELRAAGVWDGVGVEVLGTGGAARAALAAARELGARARVHGRRSDRADALAREFGATTGEGPAGTLVVHATPVGRAGEGELTLPLDSILHPGSHLLDLVYAPDEPTLARAARAAGATYEDGGRVLVYQAAGSFERWWDLAVPESEVAAGCAEVAV